MAMCVEGRSVGACAAAVVMLLAGAGTARAAGAPGIDPGLRAAPAREYVAPGASAALHVPGHAARTAAHTGWLALAPDGREAPAGGPPLEQLPPVDARTATSLRGAPPARALPAVGGRVPSFGTRVGPNDQPAWTTHRRFATVRSYVIAPGQVQFESWWEGKFRRDGDERHRYLQEVSLGLPGRLQFDLYWRVQDETGEDLRTSDVQLELRWALARWGRLPLNPTLYAEYKVLDDAPDVAEGKLLLSDELGCRVQWSANAFYERQLGGEQEVEWGVSAGIALTVVDPTLSVGVEAVYENVTVRGARDDAEEEVLLGPTLQWRPVRGVHLDVAPLLGLTDDSPTLQVWVVLGLDLAPGSSARPAASTLPLSSRSR